METETVAQQNVVIESVTADNMKVNVNGEIKQITNGFEELKELLVSLKAENFQSGDKIYNIGSITNATFNNEVGKKTLNMILYRKLTEAIQDYSPAAKSFLQTLREADKANWQSQSRYTEKVRIYIVSSFVGIPGILLRKLLSGSKDYLSNNKYGDYLELCIAICKRTLQLLCFTFLSSLWDFYKANNCVIADDVNRTILKNFFDRNVESNITEYAELFRTLMDIFKAQNVDYPFAEVKDIENDLRGGSAFFTTCEKLQDIINTLDNGDYTLKTALSAEENLATFLVIFKFLAGYKMVSVKDILYEEVRNNTVQYLHAYTLIGSNNENTSTDKYKFDKSPISTDAILICKNKSRYPEGLNLFPFIIDENALTDEKEAKICFYSCCEEYYDENLQDSQKNLKYTHVSDVSGSGVIMICHDDKVASEITGDMDITELKADSKKFYAMKKNDVYKTFQQARQDILK